jgi:malate synthase
MNQKTTAQYKSNGIEISQKITPEFSEILTPEALDFVASIHRKFNATRLELLKKRTQRQARLDQGELPDFLSETKTVRESQWQVGPIPKDLLDRRIEITGPVDRKMVINALNSGANMFMADFEDSHSPTWTGTIEGQINVRDAIRKTIQYRSPEGKDYRLGEKTAVLLIRPRGWHLSEKHMTVDGALVSGGFFDFGLYLFHNAKELLKRGAGPYFYLPKLESHLEARLWNDVFVFAQKELGLAQGTIKVTVLIETILAAFEMDEILFELREHIVGLNCGRWDYIFSFIKKFSHRPEFVLPDRSQVTMNVHFLKSYSLNLIKTCHRRGAFAMGGMAAQIPIKNNPAENDIALEKVRADKLREVTAGHDGTWVAHPGLVAIAREVFDAHLKTPNQLSVLREDVQVTASDLLAVPEGEITEKGLRSNINIGLLYLEAWLRGSGCVPLYNLMEDAATAEISRAQVWQWIHHPKGVLSDGRKITIEMFETILLEELTKLERDLGGEKYRQGRYETAANILRQIIRSDQFVEFLTLPAYENLETN